ncbi:MAG TPA: hypothetical protein DEP24_13070 [Mycobacterium sp.]|jgi:uncharacterized membrane protein|nr:hypothetical protein [Mycobacterium sp.]
MGITSVDPAALRAAALRMDTAADIVLGILRAHLADLRFDAVAAGRDYGAAGAAVREVLDRLVADVTQWAVAARETGAALRVGADRYGDAESRAVAALR